MEQLTLQQAAGNHSRRACVTHVELKRTAEEIDNIAFQAGAEWQKEQYKPIKEAIQQVFSCLANAQGRGFERTILRNALELLQD